MKQNWKKTSIKKIADIASVGTATVDRVLNNRKGVKKSTKLKILDAIHFLENNNERKKNIFLFCQSGNAYNNNLKKVLNTYLNNKKTINIDSEFILTKEKLSERLKNKILNSNNYDGLIVISTENSDINSIVNQFTFRNKPVITLTTDLSRTNRQAYVGSDQVAAGSTAAKLLTSLIKNKKGPILMIISQPFICQQEREQGFKKILRYDYPKIQIKETIQTTDTSEESYKHVKKYIKNNGPPLGIYNITGGNLGVADAIKDMGFNDISFVGHELNQNTLMLLNSDRMDYIIGHDVKYELKKAVQLIGDFYKNEILKNITSNIMIFNKYNCPKF